MKKSIYIFLIILILVGVGIRFTLINQDFSAEETDFIGPALAIMNTGHTTYYNSEQFPNLVGLFHPPMYNYILSFIFRISYSEPSARILNIFTSLLIGILIFIFCLKIINGKAGKITGVLASAMFMINYYSVSSSVLIDIDVLSALFVLAFVFFVCQFEKNQGKYYYLAGIALFFCLWNRYIIAFLIYFFIGAYILFSKNLRSKFKNYLFMGLIAGFAFLASWTVYSTIIEPGNFLGFIMHNFKYYSDVCFNGACYCAFSKKKRIFIKNSFDLYIKHIIIFLCSS